MFPISRGFDGKPRRGLGAFAHSVAPLFQEASQLSCFFSPVY